VLREHRLHEHFIGPRFLVYVAALEMHPLDTANRLGELKDTFGAGFCNITKCCTRVCPESIAITDNAIIPLKERVVDEFYDPLQKLFRIFRTRRQADRKPTGDGAVEEARHGRVKEAGAGGRSTGH
jgi:succinate dehydrogenase / fumarate reductase iron-sulfur subunit